MTFIDFARKAHYLREVGQNQGLRVNGIQIWAGGQPGDSWCLELVWFLLDFWMEGKCPFDRMQSVEAFRQHAKTQGWETPVPVPGDLVVSVKDDHGHHIAILTSLVPFTTFAGNTSADGLSSNGDRAAEHEVSKEGKEFFRVPGV
jgi:hypothetical protein